MKRRDKIIKDIENERVRQIKKEGWTRRHDAGHPFGVLATAAGCYAMGAFQSREYRSKPPKDWPWDREWWKPKSIRRDLIRAAALIVAELEKLDSLPKFSDEGGR